ncbi:MAG: hypothetical protein HYU39_00030 [Thaumarchaeota archaeon]|nr:hypothetical protein [Nitrososphaerota archaeon]
MSSDYNQFILQCVDHALSLLGESGRDAVYFYIERSFGLKKHDIPTKPQELIDALDRIFGGGATVLEQVMLREVKGIANLDVNAQSFVKVVEGAVKGRHQQLPVNKDTGSKRR